MEKLRGTFPGTQFVATSHSPLIAQVAEGENYVLLKRSEGGQDVEIINEPEIVRGWRVDQVLTSELFGLLGSRTPNIEALFNRRDALIAKQNRSPDEEAELGRLRNDIESFPATQSLDDHRDMNYIRDFAAHLRQSETEKE